MIYYSMKMIFDYVQGNDIEGYEVEELENDPEFMIGVMRYTNDKKMYSLCSDNVKHDYDFVKFIIIEFSKDWDFVKEVVDEYLSSINKEDSSYLEMCILMSDIIKKKNLDEFRYDLLATTIYNELTLEIEVVKMKEKELEFSVGKGFIYVETVYNNNSTILRYFAKRFLGEIFSTESNYTLEEIVHKKFSSVDDFESVGENNFLVSYIAEFDSSLADYVQCHIDLISELKRYLNVIKVNWNNYLNRIYSAKIMAFYSEVYRYIDEKNDQFIYFNFSGEQLIKYVINKLGLEDVFAQYDLIFEDNDFFEPEIEMYDIEEDEELNTILLEAERKLNGPIDIKELNSEELICLRDLTLFARDLFKVDYIEKDSEVASTNNHKSNGKAKVLTVDFQNRK